MKKTNLFYWIFTILFVGFMAFTAIPNVMMEPESVDFITKLGYPKYFIPFIGVAKLIGCIALLIPGFPRVKEWAYAGMGFDLVAAWYSIIAMYGFDPSQAFMLVPIVLMALSYFFYHKKLASA